MSKRLKLASDVKSVSTLFATSCSIEELRDRHEQEHESVSVATLLTVIVTEAREVFATFANWDEDGRNKIAPVLQRLATYCQPLRKIPFEIYKFNSRVQEPGESYDHYRNM